MAQQNNFGPMHFIQLFDEFVIETRNPNHSNKNRLNTGITDSARFYSVEVLFEMLLDISLTYGRLAYRQERFADDDTLSATFKKLSIGFLDLANNSYHITNADNLVRFTDLAVKNITLIKAFEGAANAAQ